MDIIKKQFVVNQMQEMLDRLKKIQLQVLEDKREELTQHRFNVDELIEGVISSYLGLTKNGDLMYTMSVQKKLRFADMKKHGNARVYNRPLWGVIFGKYDSLRTRLRDGYSQEIEDELKKKLREAFPSGVIELDL